MFMKLFMLYRDPDPADKTAAEPGTSQEAQELERELMGDQGGAGGTDIKENKETGAGKTDDKPAAAAGKSAGASAKEDDPEYDIDFKDEKGVVSKSKVKLSELKSGYLRNDDYTKKTQRLAEIEKNQKDLITTAEAIRQNPKLSKLFIGLVDGAISKEGYNDAFIDKMLGGLTGAQPESGDTKRDLQEKNEDIEDLLKDVDKDSPVARALRQTYAMNKQLMADLKGLKDEVGKASTSIKERATAEENQKYDKLVDDAGKMMNTHLDTMTDPTKSDLEFFTDGEKQEWRFKVIAFLRDNPQEYKDEKDFLARIDQVGKGVFKNMVQYREGIIARQLQGNKKPQEKIKDEDKPNPDADSFEQALAKELEAYEGNQSG